MNGQDFIAILPFLVLAATAIAVMLIIAVRRDHKLSFLVCVAGLVFAIAALAPAAVHAPRQVTPLFLVDLYALFFTGLILAAALAVALLSLGYLDARTMLFREEYYVLLLLATLGAAAVVASSHFAAFFLGLETLSVSLFGLIAYPRGIERPMEASIKYLVLAGVSSAFLLFGIALLYAELGSLSFAATKPPLGRPIGFADSFWLTGVALIIAGIGFKLSFVPFHMWAPDVYEGAPAPVTAFVAVVSKSAVFALLLRYFVVVGAFGSASLMTALSVIAILSIIAGNLLALLQDNVKRMLAYSSIAHLGYALVAFLAGGALAVEAVIIYLVAYAITTLGAFGVVALLVPTGAPREADRIADYRGLLAACPWLAAVFLMMLLSLAGIPFTLGFIAKFYAVTSGVSGSLAAPVAALIIGSIIGLYYYLRVIVTMMMPLPEEASVPKVVSPRLGGAVLGVLLVLLVGLGVYPAPLITLVRASAIAVVAGELSQTPFRAYRNLVIKDRGLRALFPPIDADARIPSSGSPAR